MVNNQKICGLIGLATKAGKIVAGTDACIQEIEKRNVKLLILAVDASDRTKNTFKEKCKEFNQLENPIRLFWELKILVLQRRWTK